MWRGSLSFNGEVGIGLIAPDRLPKAYMSAGQTTLVTVFVGPCTPSNRLPLGIFWLSYR